MTPKPCKTCGDTGHTTFNCFKNRRSPTRRNSQFMRKLGKKGYKWLRTRSEWITLNPPNHQGFYVCYICGQWITPKELEVDHIKSRSRYPELTHDLSNLAPSCHKCNSEKGSKDVDNSIDNNEVAA